MAAKGAKPASSGEETVGKKSKLGGILSFVGIFGMILCALALFASKNDLMFIDLTGKLHAMALPALGGLILFGLIAFFGSSKQAGANAKHQEAVMMRIDRQIRVEQMELRKKVDEFMGAEFERIRGENEAMHTKLEEEKQAAEQERLAAEQEKDERMNAEIEMLRQQNAELMKKLEQPTANNGQVQDGAQPEASADGQGGAAPQTAGAAA